MKSGTELIAEERQRQIEVEGWSPKHDDRHRQGEMVKAARCYAHLAESGARLGDQILQEGYQNQEAPNLWPWAAKWWKPKDPVRDLVRAAALIAAEIDRLQRKKD